MIEFYTTPTYTPMAIIMNDLMAHEGIRFTHITDTKALLQLVRGHANPLGDQVAYTLIDGELLRNVYDLVDWINRKGLRRL